MSESFYMRISGDTRRVSWVTVTPEGRMAGPAAQGTLNDAALAASGRRVIVLVPGLDVVVTRADLPAAGPSRLRQMVPFAIEESLAHDVERLFFATGTRTQEGQVPVAVVARDRLDAWLSEMRECGIGPHVIYSDAEGVPDLPATLTLVVEGERIFGRCPDEAPVALEGLSLLEAFDLLMERRGDESAQLQHVMVYVDPSSAARCTAELPLLQERCPAAELKLLPGDATELFAITLSQRAGINLLQGAYSPQSDWVSLLQPWRTAAAFVLTLGLVGFAALSAQYLSLKRTDDQLSAEIVSRCQTRFATSAINSCETQVMQTLQSFGGSADGPQAGDFLAGLSAVADARPADSRITALSYRSRVLDLQLVAPSVPALDEFARRVGDTRRFEARIQSTSMGDTGVESRVQIVSTVR